MKQRKRGNELEIEMTALVMAFCSSSQLCYSTVEQTVSSVPQKKYEGAMSMYFFPPFSVA